MKIAKREDTRAVASTSNPLHSNLVIAVSVRGFDHWSVVEGWGDFFRFSVNVCRAFLAFVCTARTELMS